MSRPGWAKEPGDAWRWRLDGSDATSPDRSITVLVGDEPSPTFGFSRVLLPDPTRDIVAVAQGRGWRWEP